MIIENIAIHKFKSINSTQQIDFDKKLITFIGKNGSGKTNALLAVKSVFEHNKYNSQNVVADITLRLDDQDIANYQDAVCIDERNNTCKVKLTNNNTSFKKLECSFTKLNVENYKKRLLELKESIEKAIKEYREQLDIIISNEDVDWNRNTSLDKIFLINGVSGIYNQKNLINNIQSELKTVIGRIKAVLDDCFEGNDLNIDAPVNNNIGRLNFGKDLNIIYKRPVENEISKRFIKIDHSGIEHWIKEINIKTANILRKLENDISQFNNLLDKLNSLINVESTKYYTKKENVENQQEGFLTRVNKLIEPKCIYLDNETGIIFGTNNMYERLKYNPIERVFCHYCEEQGLFEKYLESNVRSEEKLSELIRDWKKEGKIDKLEKKFEEFIDDHVPLFDKEMCRGVTVKCDEGFRLYLEEKNGEEVSFEKTSLGRRWYFTYFFLKSLLHKGDVFIIDEPASFLHPQAQKEVLRELEKLAQEGITVIISTHSPYMISARSTIYAVTVEENGGTQLKKLQTAELKEFKDEVGFVAYNDILLGLSRKQLLVEGKYDKLCLQIMSEQLGRSIDNIQINILQGNTQAKNLIKFFCNNEVEFLAMLDADTKNTDILKGIGEENIVFVGEDTDKKCIEGLFSDIDTKNLLQNSRGGKKKLGNGFVKRVEIYGVTEETKENFRKLFDSLGIK